MIGVLKPWKGVVKVITGGVEHVVNRLKPYQVASLGIGYVPQGRIIFPDLTVEENLEAVYGGRVPEDVLKWIYSIFPELKRIRDRRGMYLSGGEQQMLAVARALVRKPKVLLLDEPLEGLAPRAAASLKKALAEIRSEGVSLVITEPASIDRVRGLVDRAYGIDRGEIVYEGSLEGLLRDERARRRVWGI